MSCRSVSLTGRTVRQTYELTKCKELNEATHVDNLPNTRVHALLEDLDALGDIRFEIFERCHGISAADESTLATMKFLVSLGKEVEFAVTLPDTIPVRLVKSGACSVDGLDGRRICNADFIRACTYERAVLFM